ncbi:hypothetical protein [Salinibacter grassmerensis]|uniref:hypothetical protein n=1 Tax=Salinibacter grassmerensis TaxID=3040353 RepID=UPI0021E7B663|nr:hypothetical protein [Salinibacter grassmerensis]
MRHCVLVCPGELEDGDGLTQRLDGEHKDALLAERQIGAECRLALDGSIHRRPRRELETWLGR